MEFIEAPAFTRHIIEYLDDEGYSALQERLAANPRAGDMMPGTGGFRKMRWADRAGAKVEGAVCESTTFTSSLSG